MASKSGPVCLIVGAGLGISLAVARCFGAEGFKLGLIARQTDKLEEVSRTLRAEGFDSFTATADAGDEDFLRNAIRSIHDKAGETQVLVYNAFAATPSNPSNLELAQLVQDFRVNVGGALVAVQSVLQPMRRAGRGSILLTGGGFALQPAAGMASLSIGKAGIRSLALSLFQELQPAGIHAATVTICGIILEGSHFSPDKIAQEFLKLHRQEPNDWSPEIIYQ